MDNDKMIRPCGNDFKYCDGNCNDCSVNKMQFTTSTDGEKK